MRVLVIVKANDKSEAGVMPSEQLVREMVQFNEELVNAGVMLAGEGLHPSSKGKRVRFQDGASKVVDGPFAETKELIAGYWIWKVGSMEEALGWARRIPCCDAEPGEVGEIEIRPIFELEDFGQHYDPEIQAQEERQRARIEGRE